MSAPAGEFVLKTVQSPRVTVVRWSFGGFRQPAGVMRPPGEDRMSLVMVPRGNGLAIAHTMIDAFPPAFLIGDKTKLRSGRAHNASSRPFV
jgi:hypothetical protein